MTPFPLESGGGTPAFSDGNSVALGGQMGTISLGMLIQYINQRTYSDLLNMAEILQRKSDLEKKIDIVQYAQRTRQLYVRLLALVKWAASASKVDKCCHITGFLEKQNNLIVDTADKLFHMTKENLVNARLPHFHIPAAVETLTTGSYNRLPLAIRQKILPIESITQVEKKRTLSKLEQIVQHRLVTSDLPFQMRTTKVEGGCVRFTADHEFEVTLTLMSDSPNEVWRLLEVNIAVEDKETGEGKALVHPTQINFIHQLVQSRLPESSNPLQEMHSILHSFCQSLQLEVLYSQTLKLLRDRLDYHIRVEEYLQGRSLSLTYWRELTHRGDPQGQLGYRLTIQVDSSHSTRPLVLIHTPSMNQKSCELTEKALRSDKLSMERLLVHSIYLRTKARLFEIKQDIDQRLGQGEKCQLSGSPAVLHIPILQPCFRSDQLMVTVDTHTGVLLCHVSQYEGFPRMSELQSSLNGDKSKLMELFSELRYWIMVRRIEKTLQHLETRVHERLPLMYGASHPLHSIGKHKVFITFNRQPSYILVIELNEKKYCCCEMNLKMYLLVVKEASIEDDPNDDSFQTSLPKSYLRAYRLIPIEDFACLFGATTKIDMLEPVESTSFALGGKRKMSKSLDLSCKKIKPPAYFLRDVAHVVGMFDHIYPLAHISNELEQIGVKTSGVQVEDGGVGFVLRMLQPPQPFVPCSNSIFKAIKLHLLSSSVRTSVTQCKSSKCLVVEYLFTNTPLQSMASRESAARRPIYFTYDIPSAESVTQVVHSIVLDWTSVIKLYEIVFTFSKYYNQSTGDPSLGLLSQGCQLPPLLLAGGATNSKLLSEIVKVRSFTYDSLTLSYSPSFDAYVKIKYDGSKKGFIAKFGMIGKGQRAINPHNLIIAQIEDILETQGELSLITVCFVLHFTYQPLLALSKLQPTLHPGAMDKSPYPIQIFTIVISSSTRVRLFYRNIYCLEIDLLANGLVSIRDGAFSSFQMSKAIEEFTPIKGLKAFLSKYVDEGAICRRRSQSEDDNPPTPVPLDDSSSWHPPKASSPSRHGPITPPVSISSNPHTPASPHPGGVPVGHLHPSPAPSSVPVVSGGFSSPPSLPQMTSSPGYFGANSPSAGASPGFLPTPSPAGGHAPLSVQSQSPASAFVSGGTGGVSTPTTAPRMLPNRPFAASIPTILTHDAFMTLCSSVPATGQNTVDSSRSGASCSRVSLLEQFLGSTYLLKGAQQYAKNSTNNAGESGNQLKDPTSCQIKLDSLMATFSLQSSPMYKLTLSLQPLIECPDRWTSEELQALERLFLTKASCAPYRIQAIEAMIRLLCFPYKLLKDCVRLILIEMFPHGMQHQSPKWNLQWLFVVPALGKHIIPPGHNSVLNAKNKYLFYVQLSQNNNAVSTLNVDSPVLVLPIVHDVNTNKTQVAKKGDPTFIDPTSRIIQSINETMNRVLVSPMECSIYPCIREIIFNFSIGNDSLSNPTSASQTALGMGGPGGVGQTPAFPVGSGMQSQVSSSSMISSSSHMQNLHSSPISASIASSVSASQMNQPQGMHYSGSPGSMGPSMNVANLPRNAMGSMPVNNMTPMQHSGMMPGAPMNRSPIMQGGPQAAIQGVGAMQHQGNMQGQSSFSGPNVMNQFSR